MLYAAIANEFNRGFFLIRALCEFCARVLPLHVQTAGAACCFHAHTHHTAHTEHAHNYATCDMHPLGNSHLAGRCALLQALMCMSPMCMCRYNACRGIQPFASKHMMLRRYTCLYSLDSSRRDEAIYGRCKRVYDPVRSGGLRGALRRPLAGGPKSSSRVEVTGRSWNLACNGSS